MLAEGHIQRSYRELIMAFSQQIFSRVGFLRKLSSFASPGYDKYGLQPTIPLFFKIPGEAPCQSYPQATLNMAFGQSIPRSYSWGRSLSVASLGYDKHGLWTKSELLFAYFFLGVLGRGYGSPIICFQVLRCSGVKIFITAS